MSTMFADTLLIVFISVCTALLAEGERPPGGARPGRAAAKPGGLGAGPGAVVPSAGGPEAALGWRGGEGSWQEAAPRLCRVAPERWQGAG